MLGMETNIDSYRQEWIVLSKGRYVSKVVAKEVSHPFPYFFSICDWKSTELVVIFRRLNQHQCKTQVVRREICDAHLDLFCRSASLALQIKLLFVCRALAE